mmetsp:Transcript_12105/g.26445  ORF Transcript_12105/g.26445 Transcript_12105/m.26445 type:complete len:253 (-) Transcript_12105:483-1241(-)
MEVSRKRLVASSLHICWTAKEYVGYGCTMSATCCVVSCRSIHTASSQIVSPARADTAVAPTITALAPFTFNTSSINPPSSRSPSHTIRSHFFASHLATSTFSFPNFFTASSTLLSPTAPTSGVVNVTRGTSAICNTRLASVFPGNNAFRTATYPWNPATCVNCGPFATQSPAANTCAAVAPRVVVLNAPSTTIPPLLPSTSTPSTVRTVSGTVAFLPTATNISSQTTVELDSLPSFTMDTVISYGSCSGVAL